MYESTIFWNTGSKTGNFNILTEDNLLAIGINKDEIKEIKPFFTDTPNLYTENGVASKFHPCCGSVGYNIITTEGENASLYLIFYHDSGHNMGQGISHWNIEFIKTKNEIEIDADNKKTIAPHQLDDTSFITFGYKDNQGNEEQKTLKKDYSKLQFLA